ncbi:hypothetical protein B0I33_106151 [Prauserella shujinwangii]|uniref:Uncharacterized protein n=1 Tax=Prauserella shujinwangii TaxID=1453103 RepID=A0A2T0LTN6_9PSEU|nr:hypothetical protein B0I33_106151 [Prauserella shujinwangii]
MDQRPRRSASIRRPRWEAYRWARATTRRAGSGRGVCPGLVDSGADCVLPGTPPSHWARPPTSPHRQRPHRLRTRVARPGCGKPSQARTLSTPVESWFWHGFRDSLVWYGGRDGRPAPAAARQTWSSRKQSRRRTGGGPAVGSAPHDRTRRCRTGVAHTGCAPGQTPLRSPCRRLWERRFRRRSAVPAPQPILPPPAPTPDAATEPERDQEQRTRNTINHPGASQKPGHHGNRARTSIQPEPTDASLVAPVASSRLGPSPPSAVAVDELELARHELPAAATSVRGALGRWPSGGAERGRGGRDGLADILEHAVRDLPITSSVAGRCCRSARRTGSRTGPRRSVRTDGRQAAKPPSMFRLEPVM